MTGQKDKFPLTDVEIDGAKRIARIGIALMDVNQLNHERWLCGRHLAAYAFEKRVDKLGRVKFAEIVNRLTDADESNWQSE